jgi:hypothetical protein
MESSNKHKGQQCREHVDVETTLAAVAVHEYGRPIAAACASADDEVCFRDLLHKHTKLIEPRGAATVNAGHKIVLTYPVDGVPTLL